jgi:hypothetical protein
MKHMRRRILGVAFSYAVIGVVTGALAGSASSVDARDVWRLAGWVLSAVVFLVDLVYDRARVGGTPVASAARVAGSVALGAFLLAAAGPVRSYWGTERFWRVTLLSLVVWPVIAGVPAFVVGLAGGSIHRRMFAGAEPSS